MHRSPRYGARLLGVPATVAVAVTTALLTGNTPAVAATTTAAQATASPVAKAAATTSTDGLLRSVSKSASASFPAAKSVGKPSGVQTPELPPHEAQAELRAKEQASASAVPMLSSLQPPTVASTAVAGSAGLDRSWLGLTGFDQRYANGGNQFSVEPPDQALCTGSGYTLEAVNDVLRVYHNSGTAASAVTDLNSFYHYKAQYNRTTGAQGPFVTDPTCIYDHGTNRFYLTVLTLDVNAKTGALTGTNHLDLAVSKTSNPTGSWDIYRLPVQDDGSQGTPRHKDCPCIGDYPHIGSDANAVFLTTNEYPFSSDPGLYGNNFNGAQIYAFDKRALARGAGSVAVVQFQNTSLPSGDGKVPGFTVWPAQVPGTAYRTTAGGTEYFLSSVAGAEAQPSMFTGMANRIGVWAVTNTSSIRNATPKLQLQRRLVRSETYGVPPRSSQRLGPVPLRDCLAVNCQDILGAGAAPDPNEAEGPLDSGDSRMQQVYYSGGLVYGALGTVAKVGGNLRAGIAWFAVRPGASPAQSTVARQGYLAVAGNNVIYPSIAVLGNGTGAMAFTLVGSGYYPSSAYTLFGGSGTRAVQVSKAGNAPQDGFSEYNAFGSPPRPRWGDYSAAVTSGSSVYLANEYIDSRCSFAEFNRDFTCGGSRGFLINWATRISKVTP